MAGNVIEARFDQEQLQDCVAKIYEHGSGHSLWVASCLTAELPKDVAVAMTIQRLKRKLVWGARYLYTALQELDVEMSPDLLEALKNGLSSKNVRNAVAAARLVDHLAGAGSSNLMPLITSSLEYWLENEEPYPTKGGVIPDSPRAHLIGAWLKVDCPDFALIMQWLNDPRSEIKGHAKKALKNWIAKEPERFGLFLDSLEDGRSSPQALGWLLKEEISLSVDDIARVEGLLGNDKETIRFNAMSILELHYMSTSDIGEHLQKLVDDPVQQIQDRARSRLK